MCVSARMKLTWRSKFAILDQASHRSFCRMVPVGLGLTGACFLFYGSILLILEARLALSTIHSEMDFIWRQSKKATPAEIVEQHKPHFVHFRRHE